MTENREPYTSSLSFLAIVLAAASAAAQNPPRRLELSDTVRSAPRAERPFVPAPPAVKAPAKGPAGNTPVPKRIESIFQKTFVRDQTILGLFAYAPSFASAVTTSPVAWGATYLVMGGGTYFAATALSRDLAINEPTSWLATQTAVRGGLSGWALAYAASADRSHRAGAILLGSLGGAAGAVALGRGMTEGEVAASVFVADLSALGGLAATHMVSSFAGTRTRAGTAALAGLIGYPLGYWYASRASYRVSAGDVTTLWTGAAIGATAAGTAVASGHPSAGAVAAALTAGALGGTLLADRFLVRPYDHSPEDGQFVALGAAAGGLIGAGVGILTGVAHNRLSPATAALTAVGAVAGVVFVETWKAPPGDAGRKLARLELSPAGVIATATGSAGTHTILRWTF